MFIKKTMMLIALSMLLTQTIFCQQSKSTPSGTGLTPTKATRIPPAPKLPPPPTPEEPQKPVLKAEITNAVMARDVESGTLNPIHVTNKFPYDQKIYHAVVTLANAPEHTRIKVVWIDNSNNQKLGEYEIRTKVDEFESSNIDFKFQPYGDRLNPGIYKAIVYLNDKEVQALDFTVQSPPNNQTSAETAPVAPLQSPHQSGYIADVILAQDTEGEEKRPTKPTDVFSPTSTIHAVVKTMNAPPNTSFKASWYVVDVGKDIPTNRLLDTSEIVTDSTRYIDFMLKPEKTWPQGIYRVDISVDNIVKVSKTYTVKQE